MPEDLPMSTIVKILEGETATEAISDYGFLDYGNSGDDPPSFKL